MSETPSFQEIPSVRELLDLCSREAWSDGYSRVQLTSAIRQELMIIRDQVRQGMEPESDLIAVRQKVHDRLHRSHSYSLRRVINASGIIVHTNLGRAPLPTEALKHIAEVACGYTNLELNLDSGNRGSRDHHFSRLLSMLLPVEAAIVVNNNAAAILLILTALTSGKEVLVSRGELVEIGGSFRLPEIMRQSGAILKEVGTTNKTRSSDYASAITERTGMILSVHPSNYQIVGFTEKPGLSELIALGKRHGIPVVEDHGSGILLDLSQYGIHGEPDVASLLTEGLDLVCFSGDKILGGPQAGVVCGKKKFVQMLRSHPLFRALRVDKLILSALESILLLYVKEQVRDIPVLSMLACSTEELEERGERLLSALELRFPRLECSLEPTTNFVGGGVAPMKGLPSWAVSLRSRSISASEFAAALRLSDPAVLPRVEEDRVFLEVRTISVDEEEILLRILSQIVD